MNHHRQMFRLLLLLRAKRLKVTQSPRVDICYAAYDVMTEQGEKIDTIMPPSSPVGYEELLKGRRKAIPYAIVNGMIE